MTTDVQLSSIYQHLILDHYRKPRNRGRLDDPAARVHVRNPSCGDEVKLSLRIEDGVVADLAYEGEGCSISQAATSMMTTLVRGKPVDEALALAARFTEMMHGNEEAAKDRALKDLRALAGVAKFPVRVRCALLGFDALKEAVKVSEGKDAGGVGHSTAPDGSGDPDGTGTPDGVAG